MNQPIDPTGRQNQADQWLITGAWGLAFAFLAWSILVQLAIQVLPGSLAQIVAPNSPAVLTRLAEERLVESRFDAAERLARAALARQLFNARALRTLGFAVDQGGDKVEADKLMTLAGNWTLRDTAAHLWLYDYRLRTGEYESAFAHLDTVLRLQPELRAGAFAGLQRGLAVDREALAPIAERLSYDPNWRAPFLAHLGVTAEGQVIAANLALALKGAGKQLSEAELEALFRAMLAKRNFSLLKALGLRLDPGLGRARLMNGDFEGAPGPFPFNWELNGGPGATVDLATIEQSGSKGLIVEYDGYSAAPLVRQLILLPPGPYTLAGESQTDGDPRLLQWSVSCAESGARLQLESRAPAHGQPGAPGQSDTFSAGFQVPDQGCAMQWISLVTNPGERRDVVAVTYDNIRILPRGAN